MKLSDKRLLVVLTYFMEEEIRPVIDIQAELKITEDEDFQFEETLNDLIKEGSITTISPNKWEITESGEIRLIDLALDKYEEENRMSFIVLAIIIVIAIQAFMKIFPWMFHTYNFFIP
jgi:hypothetical protein